jgi:hypothetical protein
LRQPAASAGADDKAVAASSTPAAMTIDFMGSSPLRSPALTVAADASSALSRSAHPRALANNAMELA